MQEKLPQIFFELTDSLGILNVWRYKNEFVSKKTILFFPERQIFDMIWTTKNLAHKIIETDILPIFFRSQSNDSAF